MAIQVTVKENINYAGVELSSKANRWKPDQQVERIARTIRRIQQ